MGKIVDMPPLISVIVPVYNVSKYLDKCIQSIMHQTYKHLEILLVDDGSTDDSGKKCDEYALKDTRIKVIHKENGGLSSARNAAIDIINGMYITYVDSDDYVTDDYVEYLYKLLINNNADISMCQFKSIYSETDKLDVKPSSLEILTGKEAMRYYLYQKKFTASAHCKLYKKYLFDSLKYPVGRYYEDMAVICQILDMTSKIVIGNQQKYYYIQRSDSIMGEKFNPRKLHRIEVAEEIYSFIKVKHPDLIKAADARCFLAAIQTYREIPLIKEYEAYIDIIWKEILKYRKKIIIDTETKLSHKIIGIMTYFGKHCLKVLGDYYTYVSTR